MSVEGLNKLQVWQRAKDFAVFIHREILPSLPIEEKWGLRSQLSRSSQSIAANLAEGYGRFYYQDNVRFCYIARGSLEETLSHLIFALEVEHITREQFEICKDKGENLTKLINGYIRYLKQSKRGATEPGSNLNVRKPPPTYDLKENEPPN